MPAENASGPAGDDAPNQQLHFVERLASVPLVAGVFGIVSQRYAAIKARSPLLSAALWVPESVAVAAIGCCEDVLRVSLGPQLEDADALACRGIEKLEQCCPAALRRPDEIAADVVAFGRRKAVKVKRCGLEQVERTRKVIVAAFHAATHPVAAVERSYRAVDQFLDMWISGHDPDYDVARNRLAPSHTFGEFAFTSLRKLRTVATLQLACECAAVEELSSAAYKRFQRFLQKTPSRSQPAQTVRDRAIAASQHALLASLLVVESAGRSYSSLRADFVQFYRSCTATPEASRSPSPSAASTPEHSREPPDDCLCSVD